VIILICQKGATYTRIYQVEIREKMRWKDRSWNT